MIDDNYILNKFLDKNGNPNRRKLRLSFLSKDEYEYLIKRFSVFDTLSEVVYRIKYKIEELPKCPVCGKEIHYKKESRPFSKYCSHKCKNRCHEHNEKIKQTCLERYGESSALKVKKFRQKAKQTCLERYGDENYNNREQFKNTCLERYGEETPLKNKQCIEQSKITLIRKYGVDNYGKTRENILATHSKEVNEKRNNTKRKNGTFNSSKPENLSYKLLKEKFDDVIYQYKSEVYPFICDFYIPSLKMYIECNYHWTHGFRPFSEKDNECIKLLNKWKEGNTKYYNNAIITWTIRDVQKRKVAKENNLNYKEFWNINELKKFIDFTEQ